MLLKKEGQDAYLVEASLAHGNQGGQKETLNRLPGTKRRPDENQFVTAQRVLKRQLKMDENFASIKQDDVKVLEDDQQSLSYPGMKTLYRKRIISAELAKVP